ncbi:MAG: septum formation protein [Candidatus Tokpelaia sp. JSC085]|nr:MAG: septum formation protein [Candidatus Tokpelaia sp. JSC085]
MTQKLILASLSPFRARLMRHAGLMVKVEGARIDERYIENKSCSLSAEELALKLAEEKSREVSLRFPHAIVIGCDQILELEGEILHKPVDMEAAYRRLVTLSGKTHHLRSAVALFKNGDCLWNHVAQANMTVRPLDPQYISDYFSRVGPDILTSLGAYKIEREGIQIFEKIEGDYFSIVGLPLLPLLAELRELGAING